MTTLNFDLSADLLALKDAVEKICARRDMNYWLECDSEERFPQEFFKDMADAGFLGLMMPEEYGGAGLGITEASVLMQAIVESGAGLTGVAAVHSYVFSSQPIVVHGTAEQKRRMLIPLLKGEHRAAFAVSEPNTGLDTTRLRTRAKREGDHYVLSGEKIWPTCADISDRMLIIARTTPLEECKRPVDGLTLFYAEMDKRYIETAKIPKMGRNALGSFQIFIDGLRVPVEDRIGEEGKGFSYLLDGLNPERILVAAEAIGLGRAAIARASQYAKDRVVFDRPIGQNQAVQHPLAQSWMELESANLMMLKAASLYDQKRPCGTEANAAKYLAGEAGFHACSRAIMAHGGFGYAKEFHVERFMREVFIPRLAPVSPELILCYIAERVLGLPRSY